MRRSKRLTVAWAVVLGTAILVGPNPQARAAHAPSRAASPADQARTDQLACFVDGTHRVFLGRAGSGDEIRIWLAFFSTGVDRSLLPSSLATSDAWLNEEVRNAYRVALDREPDTAGLRYWTDQLRRGALVSRITALIYGSGEFLARSGGTTDGFVRQVYDLLLHRLPDAEGLRYWRAQVGRVGRGRVAAQVFNSVESRRDRVVRLYDHLLGRPSDPAGERYWIAQLGAINDVQLAAALTASEEFFARTQRPCLVPLTVLTPSLPRGRAGIPYAVALQRARGSAPITWSATGLPAGLRLSGDQITGTPGAAGRATVRVTATDGSGAVATHALLLEVIPPRRAARPVVDGYGAWIDVYDWTQAYANGRPAVTEATIDQMDAEGVDTLYIQTARRTSAGPLVEEARARSLIARAKSHGMAVVAWYLPTLTDLSVDLARLVASARLPVDAIGVDIESTEVVHPDERNRRLIQLSAQLRAATPKPVIAITLSPVAIEDLSPTHWPRFPWRDLWPHYDAWMPMAYWGYRTPGSTWHDGYRYTLENIRRVRADLGDPGAVVSTIGSPTAAAHIDGMIRAVRETGAVGGGVYDWASTPASLRPSLRPLTNLG